MPPAAPIGLDAAVFRRLSRRYRRLFGLGLLAVRPDGTVLYRDGRAGPPPESTALRRIRVTALDEALRWGEPTPQMCPDGWILWAVPLMLNARVVGGLLAVMAEGRLFEKDAAGCSFNTHGACAELRRLAEQENLTNAALLEAHRADYLREQKRAEGIHAYKQLPRVSLREMYMLEQPALIAAIRRDDRGEARSILNHILAAILHQAGNRLDVTKSFFMELVVTLTRIAVEAGGAPQELLGTNYQAIAELAAIQSDETLAPWLHQMLERIMDAIQKHPDPAGAVAIDAALRYMQENSQHDVSRDEVAKAAHLSPAHFSRLFRKHTGQTFTFALNDLRTNRAAELLVRTSTGLAEIALEAGFRDQSYFTKVFRRSTGQTPRQYRLSHASRAPR